MRARSALASGLLAAAAAEQHALARRAEQAHPPAGRFLEAGGIRLHVLEEGAEGSAVVLLHGRVVTAGDFRASTLLGRLARGHRVLAFDRPGYGYSTRPRDRIWSAEAQAAVLADAFARLGIERPVVVGHSIGALVAAALALDHPEAVGGLVLLSGYFYPTPRLEVALYAPLALPLLGDAMRYSVAPFAGRLALPALLRRMFRPNPVPPGYTAAVPPAMVLRPWQIKASAGDAAGMSANAARLAPRYGGLKLLPVALVCGDADAVVAPERHSVRLHRALPASALHVVRGAGHMVHHAAPDRVAEVVGQVVEAARRREARSAEPEREGA